MKLVLHSNDPGTRSNSGRIDFATTSAHTRGETLQLGSFAFPLTLLVVTVMVTGIPIPPSSPTMPSKALFVTAELTRVFFPGSRVVDDRRRPDELPLPTDPITFINRKAEAPTPAFPVTVESINVRP